MSLEDNDVLGVFVPELGLRQQSNRWSYSIARFESETRLDYAWRLQSIINAPKLPVKADLFDGLARNFIREISIESI